MQQLKVQHFASSNPGVTFPTYHSLDSSEAEKIRRALQERLGLADSTDDSALPKKLVGSETFYEGANAQDEGFDLLKVLDFIGVHSQKHVYVNWYRFDAIDRIALDDLARYFDDIWYPSSDDIDVFDSTLSWVLSVRHDGAIGFVKLESTAATANP